MNISYIAVSGKGWEEYILFVGPINERKNLTGLMDAFKILKQKGHQHKLIITGNLTMDYSLLLKKKCKELKLENEIVFTGMLNKEELVYFYNSVTLMVYPSFYEDFGYPPLEAMACSCPVITSNVSSLPEIVDNAGILINPNSVDEIAEAIYNVISDKKLKAELSAKGLRRAKEFSWGKTAKETLNIYQTLQ